MDLVFKEFWEKPFSFLSKYFKKTFAILFNSYAFSCKWNRVFFGWTWLPTVLYLCWWLVLHVIQTTDYQSHHRRRNSRFFFFRAQVTSYEFSHFILETVFLSPFCKSRHRDWRGSGTWLTGSLPLSIGRWHKPRSAWCQCHHAAPGRMPPLEIN